MLTRKRRILSTQERRWTRLKRELARGFQRGTCRLLDRDWLFKNDVTLTESGRLADWIGQCLVASLELDKAIRVR